MTGATADPTATPAQQEPALPAVRERSFPRAGWMVVASKEFGDHLLSSRFIVLAIIMALAAAVPLYFLSGQIRDAPTVGDQIAALFIALFWLAPSANDQITLPSVVGFLGLVGPLLGLAFAFDAINGERATGTLPRLLSQPIHRDDVINGKFAAGLAVIALVVVVMVLGVSAFAMIRLGIVPEPAEILRVALWVLVTLTYIALWLAFGMLLSVAIRRAATSALVGFGVWLLLSIFGGLIVSLVSGVLVQVPQSGEDLLRNASMTETPSALPARHALPRGVADAAQPAGHDRVDTRNDRRVRPGATADRVRVLTRPELHPRVAAGGGAGRPDRRLLRPRVRAVHAPGSPGLETRSSVCTAGKRQMFVSRALVRFGPAVVDATHGPAPRSVSDDRLMRVAGDDADEGPLEERMTVSDNLPA